MLIYLVGQDKKSEDDNDIVPSNSVENQENPGTGGMERVKAPPPVDRVSIPGLDLETGWVDNVQEQRQCTFTR